MTFGFLGFRNDFLQLCNCVVAKLDVRRLWSVDGIWQGEWGGD